MLLEKVVLNTYKNLRGSERPIKKRFVIMILSVFMILSMTAPALASDAKEAPKPSFSQDTVIVEDNMNEILKYYGINPTKAKKNNNHEPGNTIVTVGDLERAIEAVNQTPKKIIVSDDNLANFKVINYGLITDSSSDHSIMATGTATAFKDVKISSSCDVRYSASGRYYKSGSTKYWTSELGGDVREIKGNGVPGLEWEVSAIRKLTNRVFNPSTSNSYLRLDYDYTVTAYYGVGDFRFPGNSLNVSGYTNFYGSTYL